MARARRRVAPGSIGPARAKIGAPFPMSMDDSAIPRGVATIGNEATAVVHFDGASQQIRGERIATYGFTLVGIGEPIEDCGLAVPPGAPHATNNVAEYCGAICALERLHSEGFRGHVVVRGDSQLVIRQMTGEYRVESEHLKAYHDRLSQLVRQFTVVRFEWVPREQNVRADELSKDALEVELTRRTRAGRSGGAGAGGPRST